MMQNATAHIASDHSRMLVSNAEHRADDCEL